MSLDEEADLARQLAETMALQHHVNTASSSDVVDLDPDAVRRWTQELVDGLARRMVTSPDQVESTADRILQNATDQYRARMTISSVEEKVSQQGRDDTKDSIGAAATMTSFSLLGSLLSSESYKLPPVVDWEDVSARKEDMTPEDTLELLKQISYVDDVTQDWDSVQSILWEGWSKTMHHGSSDLAQSYLRLHTTWFEQCDRSTMWLRYDLCRGVLRGMQHLCTHRCVNDDAAIPTSNDEFLWNMVNVWYDMWTSSQFTLRQGKKMISTVTRLMGVSDTLTTRNSTTASTSQIRLCECLALCDKHARWFHKFLKRLSPHDILDVVREWMPSVVWELKNTPQTGIATTKLQLVVRTQNLCMVRSVLVGTRVALFPWWQLSLESPPIPPDLTEMILGEENQSEAKEATLARQAPSVEVVCDLATIFLNMVSVEATVDVIDVAEEALETLLWGCLLDKENLGGLLELLGLDLPLRVPAWDMKLLVMLLQLLHARSWKSADKVFQLIVTQIKHLSETINSRDLESLGTDDKAKLAELCI